MNTYNIDTEIANKFWPPQKKSIELYKERINEAWKKVGASVKRITTQTSILLALGFVSLHCMYV